MNSKKLRHKIMNSFRDVFTVPVVMARSRNLHHLVYYRYLKKSTGVFTFTLWASRWRSLVGGKRDAAVLKITHGAQDKQTQKSHLKPNYICFLF